MSLPNPVTRKEQYLNEIATGEHTKPGYPVTREEMYLDAIAEGGGSGGTGYETITGNPLEFDSPSPQMVNMKCDIVASQDLHGYDKPWAGGEGKNKLPLVLSNLKPLNTDGTWSENVYTLNGTAFEVLTDSAGNVEGIKVDGTANAQTLFNCGEYVPTAETSIKFNGVPETGSQSTYSINFYLTGSGFGDDIYSGDSDVITIPANEKFRYLIVIRGGYNAQSLMFYPMVRLATETDPTFEPYSNICPISGVDTIDIDVTGGESYTIDLDGTRYGGTLDVTSGV